MEKTHLIQRLLKPLDQSNPLSTKANAFGGGLKYGGLREETANLLSQIWTFDYMGSAEFEWGAVPNALSKIWNYTKGGRAKTGIVALPKDVYYLCETEMERDVKKIIKRLYKNERRLHLKENCFLRESIDDQKYFEKYGGWLELDNGFMFFIDEEMYNNTLKLFGINR